MAVAIQPLCSPIVALIEGDGSCRPQSPRRSTLLRAVRPYRRGKDSDFQVTLDPVDVSRQRLLNMDFDMTTDTMNSLNRIALIGFGEVGQMLARELSAPLASANIDLRPATPTTDPDLAHATAYR